MTPVPIACWLSALAPEDRCHLNGLAMDGGAPRFVTVAGLSDQKDGWRADRQGGGAVIDTTVPGALAVGKRNADFAHEWLAREGIPLVASDFLGPWSRKILLVPATGDAFCKRMTSSLISQDTLRREEQAYAESLINKPVGATDKKIELF